MLITVLLLAIGIGAVIYTLATPARDIVENDRRTAAALSQAREALVGYAVNQDRTPNRPGALPCPDTDNDGAANGPDVGTGLCTSYIGRLPWRTLGLPDLRDGSGERLWYALSPVFRNWPGAPFPGVLNSDTAGQLTVTGSVPAANVIAAVIAPGKVLGAQTRGAADENNVANYLEGDNANGDAIYTTALATATFNDRLITLTRDALFPPVEFRVAREVPLLLRAYYAANGYYPHAAAFPGFTATQANFRGNLPTSTCAPVPAVPFPAWFTDNNWQNVMVYAVAPRCTPSITNTLLWLGTQPPCSLLCIGPIAGLYACLLPDTIDTNPAVLNCNNTAAGTAWLTVTGVPGSHEALVMPASYRLGAQPVRPCNTIADCLEAVGASTENIDATDNFVYVKPVRSATNNDNLIVVGP